jgi:glycosyltransferase involved in cell wall biosynthesis
MKLPKPYTENTRGWPWIKEGECEYSEDKPWPKISIVTPSYNQGRFIEQTIRSVLLQGYPNLEYIIIDGGSSDETVEIISYYTDWISYWVSEKDEGQADALNKGFGMVTGEIVAWINSDDYYDREAFFKIAKIYMQHPFSLLCGASKMVTEQGFPIQELYTKKIAYNTLLKYWQPHFCPPQPSLFFQRKVLESLGNLNTSLHYSMDYDLWLRASKKFVFETINVNLSYYRVHDESKTGSGIGMKKFIPEWKLVISKSLEQESLVAKMKFRIREKAAMSSRFLEKIFSMASIKSIIRILITNRKWKSG